MTDLSDSANPESSTAPDSGTNRDSSTVPDGERDVLQHVGSFRFLFDDERWEWSDEVAALHGYTPGEVEPTTELMARHKHPEDRVRFEALVAEMLTRRTPFSSRHRIIDTRGRTHHVAVIAQPIADENGATIGTEGFYLDLSDLPDNALAPTGTTLAPGDTDVVDARVTEQVKRFRENQGAIEQAKGMLMLAYGIDADRAFEVLRWRSQTANVKLNALCASLVARAHTAVALPGDVRLDFDHLLLNAHLDIV